jgi:WD40 repeat protein
MLTSDTHYIQPLGILSPFDISRQGSIIRNNIGPIYGITEDPENETIYASISSFDVIYKITRKGMSKIGGDSISDVSQFAYKTSPFLRPYGILFDTNQKVLFVADSGNNNIKQVKLDGTVTSITEGRRYQPSGYPGLLRHPMYLAFTKDRNLLITDSCNHRVRILNTKTGIMSTLAGSGEKGYEDGDVLSAKFHKPIGIAVAKDGNIFVCDSKNDTIRKIGPDGKVSSFREYLPEPGRSKYVTWRLMHLQVNSCWNLVIVDDLLIISQKNRTRLEVFKMEKVNEMVNIVPYMAHYVAMNLKGCIAMSSSLDGTILATIGKRITRFQLIGYYSLSKESEEEHLSL